MDITWIQQVCDEFIDSSGLNRVDPAVALEPSLAGMAMYEYPLIGIAKADDPLFNRLLEPEVVGPHFRLPGQWLPEAVSVISLFFPYAAEVKASNRLDPMWPSNQWLHARIEGQEMINAVSRHVVDRLVGQGFQAVAPSLHPDFRRLTKPFSSNWSERHVAHVAGLGTFGLSAVFISRKGAAGRIASVVTNASMEPTARDYDSHDAWCTHCGACVPRCKLGALSISGKDKEVCGQFTEEVTKKKYAPRYGCGKCYVAVPCESRAPGLPRQ